MQIADSSCVFAKQLPVLREVTDQASIHASLLLCTMATIRITC
jgi:hypothetical protein